MADILALVSKAVFQKLPKAQQELGGGPHWAAPEQKHEPPAFSPADAGTNRLLPRLDWPPQLRESLGTPEPMPPEAAPVLWSQLQARIRRMSGLEADSELAPDLKRFLELIEQPEPTADLPGGVSVALAPGLAPLIIAELKGPVAAARAWVAAEGVQVAYRRLRIAQHVIGYQVPLYHALKTASPEVQRECIEILDELANGPRAAGGAKTSLMANLVRALPSHQPWVVGLAHSIVQERNPNESTVTLLISCLDDQDLLLDTLRAAGPQSTRYVQLLHRFGLEVAPFIYEEARKDKELGNHFVEAFTAIVAPEAAACLASALGRASVRKGAAGYFRRHPELLPELRRVALGKGRTATMAAEILESASRSQEHDKAEEASVEELPGILSKPPWVKGSPLTRHPLVVKDLRIPDWCRVDASAYVDAKAPGAPDPAKGNAKDEDVARFKARMKGPSRWHLATILMTHDGLLLSAEQQLEVFNEHGEAFRGEVVPALIKAHGERALPGLVRSLHRHRVEPACLLGVDAPLLAPEMALGLLDSESREHADGARRWLSRHLDAAIQGLLPAAVGALTSGRTASEDALRWLAREGCRAKITSHARSLGPKVERAVIEVLDEFREIHRHPENPRKMPKTWIVEELPRPLLHSGKALPREALEHLGTMLAWSERAPYAGLELVKEACTPRSLAELGWHLASTFDRRGGERWMASALMWLGDEEHIRRSTPKLGKDAIIEALGRSDHPSAAMELVTVWHRSPREGQRESLARKALVAIATRRGLSLEQLVDSLDPVMPLDAQGEALLDLGRRQVRLSFDSCLKPRVTVAGGDGSVLKKLPAAAPGDDPEKRETAQRLFTDLVEDVSALASVRIESLEVAMAAALTWKFVDFERCWIRFPLVRRMVESLVWGYRSGAPGAGPREMTTFRVAEDGSFANSFDLAIDLPEAGNVFLPHPLTWPDDSQPRWAELLADYELIQPIRQVGRSLPSLIDEELDSTKFTRPLEMTRWRVARLNELLGWERGLIPLGNGSMRYSVDFQLGSVAFDTAIASGKAPPFRELPRDALLLALGKLGVV